MSVQGKLRELKSINLAELSVSIAIVKEYKVRRVSQYSVKYVKIESALENRLRRILNKKIEGANLVEEFSYDSPEPEDDVVHSIESSETDFAQIFEMLQDLNPEHDVIEDIDELVKAKSYLLIARDLEGIKLVGFTKLPENWKMKRTKGLIPLLFRENQFEDLDDEPVFSISNWVDFVYYDNILLILSIKNFEAGLNFREGMINKANNFYEEQAVQDLFINLDILINKAGNNQRYLKKIATIKNLGYYTDQVFLQRLRTVNDAKNWGIEFNEGKIVISEDSLESILTLLQNKRLHSELSEEDFDVSSVKKLEV